MPKDLGIYFEDEWDNATPDERREFLRSQLVGRNGVDPIAYGYNVDRFCEMNYRQFNLEESNNFLYGALDFCNERGIRWATLPPRRAAAE